MEGGESKPEATAHFPLTLSLIFTTYLASFEFTSKHHHSLLLPDTTSIVHYKMCHIWIGKKGGLFALFPAFIAKLSGLPFNSLMTTVFWKFSSKLGLLFKESGSHSVALYLLHSYHISMLRTPSLLESQEKKSPRLMGYNLLCPLLYPCRSKGSLYRCIRF